MPQLPPYDINALLRQVAEDDDSAFRQVFDHYRAPFYSAAFKMTHSPDTAAEIVQEVFVDLWEKRQQVAAARIPEAYLLRMLHNTIYTHFRKIALEQKLKRTLVVNAAPEGETTVEETLLAKEDHTLLETVINQLPPQQQLVYRLMKQDGLSRDEVAKQLSISPNTVKNHLASAVEFITTRLKKGPSALIWAIILESL